MSGLVRFFQSFLPQATIDPSAAVESGDAQSQEDGYRQSLSTLASYSSSRQGQENSSLTSPKKNPRGYGEEERNLTQQQTDDTKKDEEDHDPLELISLEQWHKERNESLSIYMAKRLVSKEDQDEEQEGDYDNTTHEEEEEYQVPDNDGLDVPTWDTQQHEYGNSQEPETEEGLEQPETPTAPTPLTPSSRTVKKIKQVPHVDDTKAIVSSLDSIDLYTHQVNLDLLRIEKVWPLRRTRRRKWQDHSNVGTAMPCGNGSPLPLLPYKFFEDDGPFGTLYKQVVSIEVTQLNAPQTQELKEVTAAAFGSLWKPSRMRIFFYGGYASHVSNFLDQSKPDSSTLLLSLGSVPAKCVLPYTTSTSSWFDRETLAEHCLCIGDKSSLKMKTNDVSTRVHFDDEHLNMKLAWWETEESNLEVCLGRPELDMEELSPATGDDGTLLSAFEQWKKLHAAKERETSATRTENEADRDVPREGTGESKRAEPESRNEDEPSPKRPKTEVHYHRMNELPAVLEEQKGSKEAELNVFGTVLSFSSPTLTKRGDWMITMSIVDETLPLPNTSEAEGSAPHSVTLIVFCKEQDELPKPLIAGDVIRCHRVAVQQWQGDIQLVGRRRSSYVMIRRKEETTDNTEAHHPDNWILVPTAKISFTLGQEGHDRAVELWHWAQERILSYPTMMKLEHRFKLSDMRRNGDTGDSGSREEVISRDLTVMVTGVIPVPVENRTGVTPRGFIRVWDGTGPPRSEPLPIATSIASGSIKSGDPPAEALVSIKNTVGKLHGDGAENDYNAAPTRFSFASILEPPKCLCGCVVNVAIWEEPHWELAQNSLPVGKFIRLRHVRESQLPNGLRCLMVYSKSQLTPLPERTYEIRTLLEDHQKRVIRKEPHNPQSGLLPLDGVEPQGPSGDGGAVDSAEQDTTKPETTQRNTQERRASSDGPSLAQCIADPPPASHFVNFRIVRTTPDVKDDDIGLRSLCVPRKGSNQKMTYHFAVHIKDGSGEIDAIVSNNLAESLLGRTADEASNSSFRASQMLDVMKREDTSWNGTVRSVLYREAKFFVLESASIAKRGSDLLDLSSLPAHTW